MDMLKVKTSLGNDTIEAMDAMDENELKAAVVQAHGAMKQVAEELAANEKYQEAKKAVELLSSGKREVDKRQKAKLTYSLYRLEELGKLGVMERLAWDDQSRRTKQKLAAEAAKAAAKAQSLEPAVVDDENSDND